MNETVSTVRFARLEQRGVLLGLSGPQLALLGIAGAIAVIAEYSAGVMGLAIAAIAWAPLAAVAIASVRGRRAVDWAPIVADWLLRRATGATRQVRRLSESSTRDGQLLSLAVPGVRRPLTVRTAANGAALIHDRAAGTSTAVLTVRGHGVLLAEPGAQAAAIVSWGRLLAGLTQSSDIVRLQVLHTTAPAAAVEARRWWADNAMSGDLTLPARVLADLLADADETTNVTTTVLALAIRHHSGTGADAQLARLVDAVHAVGLTVQGWLTPEKLAQTVRRAYEPASHRLSGHAAAVELGTPRDGVCGPMGVQESWSLLRTDTAVHATYWISEWPRADIGTDFLQPLLLAPGVHRTVSLIAEPQPLRVAARDIRRARADLTADAAHRARTGRIEDEASRAEADDVAVRERDLVAGHGDLRFTGLVTVTARDEEALHEACRAIEGAAAQAMCELRPLVGQQAAAHTAAALPLARGVL